MLTTRRAPVAGTARDVYQFVRLSDGRCHYRVEGPVHGPTILLIHGATVPAWEFDRLVPYLTVAGFRTVRADLFGHGYSDRPRTRYAHALFVRQLSELLSTLTIAGPLHLLGHSLGAALAARLLCGTPARFARAVLAAPLVDFMANAPATRALRWPVVGEVMMPAYVVPMLVRRRTRNYGPIDDGRFVDMFKNQLARPGFGRALLSMFRSGALGDQRDCYRALGTEAHPVLVLRGAKDAIVTPAQIGALRELMPRARFEEIAGAGHPFLLTHPALVAPLIIDFFRGGSLPA